MALSAAVTRLCAAPPGFSQRCNRVILSSSTLFESADACCFLVLVMLCDDGQRDASQRVSLALPSAAEFWPGSVSVCNVTYLALLSVQHCTYGRARAMGDSVKVQLLSYADYGMANLLRARPNVHIPFATDSCRAGIPAERSL